MSIAECYGCHPGPSEDFVATASKVAFMATGFTPSRESALGAFS
jgi:hypothetical protein